MEIRPRQSRAQRRHVPVGGRHQRARPLLHACALVARLYERAAQLLVRSALRRRFRNLVVQQRRGFRPALLRSRSRRKLRAPRRGHAALRWRHARSKGASGYCDLRHWTHQFEIDRSIAPPCAAGLTCDRSGQIVERCDREMNAANAPRGNAERAPAAPSRYRACDQSPSLDPLPRSRRTVSSPRAGRMA